MKIHYIEKPPKQMTEAELNGLGHQQMAILSVIRAKCIDCSCGQYSEVANCQSKSCALWPYRMGNNPFRSGRSFTDEQKQAAAKRLEGARAARAAKKA